MKSIKKDINCKQYIYKGVFIYKVTDKDYCVFDKSGVIMDELTLKSVKEKIDEVCKLCMKYRVSFEINEGINNGKSYLCIHDEIVTSEELKKIQKKIKNPEKYKIGKIYTIVIK